MQWETGLAYVKCILVLIFKSLMLEVMNFIGLKQVMSDMINAKCYQLLNITNLRYGSCCPGHYVKLFFVKMVPHQRNIKNRSCMNERTSKKESLGKIYKDQKTGHE